MRNLILASLAFATMAAVHAADGQKSPVVNPAGNPLLGGTWKYSSGGIRAGTCSKTRTFAARSQTGEFQGKVLSRHVNAYAVSGKTVYVQERPGSGGTTAYVVISPNEIMDTLGTGACHWKR